MSISFNQVTIAGNLTRDPETKSLPSGATVTESGLAINETWKDKQTGQKKERCDFVDISFFGRVGEVLAEYCGQGDAILVSGKLRLDQWENDEGQKRSKLRVIGQQMQMLKTKGGGGGQSQPAQQTQTAPAADGPTYEADHGEIPF